MKRIGLLAWVVLLGILVIAGSATAGQNGNGAFTGQQTLTAAEAENLAFLREEEKLARDVYIYLFKEWGQWIFENIAASEQQHMDAVKKLLDKYGQEDPAEDNDIGEFTDEFLRELYQELIGLGTQSKLDALYVGATIEDMDIVDLQLILEGTEKLDIIKVCNNLMKGSRNHLRAFVGEIELLGETYEPQYLDEDEFNAIIDSQREIGPY
jgi:hypothetical protein